MDGSDGDGDLESELKRGDVITTVLPGDNGKSRPAVVVQSDRLALLASILVCPLTSGLTDSDPIRVSVEPTPENGLRLPSQIMVDKMAGIPKARCGDVIGTLGEPAMEKLNIALALALGLAD